MVKHTHFIHSSFRHRRQWETTSTERFSLDRAASSLFNKAGPERPGGRREGGGVNKQNKQ